MKKFFAVILVLTMLCAWIYPACADYEISSHSLTHVAYLEGKLDDTTDNYVTLLVKDSSGNLAHIGQYTPDSNGKYSAKFEIISPDTEFTYSIKEGKNEVNADVTLSRISTEPISVDVRVANDANGGKYISEESLVSAVANIKNKFSVSKSFRIIISFYDENGNLLDCKSSDLIQVGFDDIDIVKKLSYGTIPQNTATVKAFAWTDLTTLAPIAKADTTGIEDTIFGKEDEPVVVAFLGDSITFMAYQQRFVESFYVTRFPDRDVEFLNKGIGGDTAQRIINRFGWDITEEELSKAPQEASLMIGMNDIQRGYYPSAGSNAQKQAKIDECLANIERIILMCKERGISLTLVTPSLYDEGDYTNAASSVATGANAALGKVADGVKQLSQKYDLPLIDLHEATNYWTDTIRSEEKWANDAVINSSDRIHPGEFGGFIMGYEYVKAQGISPIIASVDIDVSSALVNCDNAVVTNLKASNDNVSYTYKANSLPVAYTQNYIDAEAYGIPVTEDINREIIKVTGLAEGTYKIKMNGKALSNEYTADELAEGINIAIDENNPGQITSKLVNEKSVEKVKREGWYRVIAEMESVAKSAGFDMADTDALNAWLESNREKTYYEGRIEQYNYYKPRQVSTWNLIKTYEKDARNLAKTNEIEVIIEKQ